LGSIFLVNLPLCAAGLFATFAWVPKPNAKPAQSSARASQPAAAPRSIDLPGQLLAIITLTAFTGAVIELRPLGLTHPLVAGGFILALIAGIAFVTIESRLAAPMLPLSLFRKRSFTAPVLFGICVNLTYYGMVFVLSLYLQRVRGYTPLQAGLAFLPLTGGFLVSNVASGWVVGHYGVRVPMICGALIAALGYASLHFVGATTPLIGLLLPFLLIPSGMGLAVPAMTTAILASVEKQRAGTASAVLNTARQAGGAVGVAAFGALVSGAGAAHIVFGMQVATAISAGLLIAALVLGCLVHPEPHAQEPDDKKKSPLRAVRGAGRG
jgi:DHA2 family methylenomycin A resistance protein-like MFS transporter